MKKLFFQNPPLIAYPQNALAYTITSSSLEFFRNTIQKSEKID
ncbi:hypothetical protein CLOSTMETH_03690 [[Clostridium] methylpentosum DSM 5476]|uniref:Uncharacterized protein n=1 Tax=[Clostridium] methylpentosum DSM 5476 TaxID=537013 RepID=C0EIJ5_9FIRM|nr:hypothetical protein CLOSTMETH_03690 [[Clostridium] methylpentosum DSM 5476]